MHQYKPFPRLKGISQLFKAVTAPISDYARTGAIYQLDLEGDASWSDVSQALKAKVGLSSLTSSP